MHITDSLTYLATVFLSSRRIISKQGDLVFFSDLRVVLHKVQEQTNTSEMNTVFDRHRQLFCRLDLKPDAYSSTASIQYSGQARRPC